MKKYGKILQLPKYMFTNKHRKVMLLPLNQKFEHYTPVEVLPQSTPYREEYVATDIAGRRVTLIVYNIHALPEHYINREIPEYELYDKLKSRPFSLFMEKGEYDDDYIHLKWIALQNNGGMTLAQCIKENRDFTQDINGTLEQFNGIVKAMIELSYHLKNGGHNNINPNNIIIDKNCMGEDVWYLTGLGCICEPCDGKVPFDENVLNVEFRAPETALGKFNQSSDIFSLGMVLSYLLQGKSPWSNFMLEFKPKNMIPYVKHVRENSPMVDDVAHNKCREVIKKATAARISLRYRNLNELEMAVGKILGYKYSGPAKDETGEKVKEPVNGQPATTAKFERISTGNGFRDVAGMEDLKSILSQSFVDIVKNRDMAEKFGIKPANGIILHGPPGVGKTFIASKLAEESGLQYSLIAPSDLANIYLHGSQSMIADLFRKSEEMAIKNKCGVMLIFDEFDSLVPKRGSDNDNNHQANEVAEFLTRLNNCADKGIYVVATTNRIDAIDPAVLRRGRVDSIIYVDLPCCEARKELFAMELAKRPHNEIDLDLMAKLTEGYTSSDISAIVKECARNAFQCSILSGHIVEISQELMETAIRNNRSSVTENDLKYYEQMRNRYSNDKKEQKPRIGFKK